MAVTAAPPELGPLRFRFPPDFADMHVIPGGQNGPQYRIRRTWLDPQHRPVTFRLRGKHSRHARQTLNRAACDVNDHGRVTRGGWG